MRLITLAEARSTNTELATMHDAEHGTVVRAVSQTAGRGQRGNSWEAAAGMNLTFSLLLRPRNIVAARQFELSQVVALSVAAVLSRYIPEGIKVKWPNDIYYRDLKICGILIENTLSGRALERSIVGIGINVNQPEFLSDAPNPVSMAMITGRRYDLDALLSEFCIEILRRFDAYDADPRRDELTDAYMAALWRADGFYPYRDAATGEQFEARIASIAPHGPITLVTPSGHSRTYAFKEVTFL